jgi:hypothetical protein
MPEPIKFNVIIPTRERCDTLLHTLRTVVEQRYANLSIIVSDNFSTDATRAVTESFADPRIRYINTGKRLGMSQNWEFALDHVSEGWVTFLGDDDGMLPGALARVAEVIQTTGTRAVMSQWRFYFWPKSTPDENRLIVPGSTGLEVRDSKRWLAKLMHGKTDYHELPYLYTGGFAELKLVNAARHGDGRFFCSMTPDVYSAIALASTTDSYVMLNEPACVMGVSAHSNGASNFGSGTRRGPGDLFYAESNIPFHPALGPARVKAIQLLVYECYLQAVHLHHDALRVALREQLSLALARATPQDYPEVKSYCEAVAQKNPEVGALPSRLRQMALHWFVNWGAKLRGIKRALADLSIDARDYRVDDVHGAAVLSLHLYRLHAGRHRGLRRACSLVARRLGLSRAQGHERVRTETR